MVYFQSGCLWYYGGICCFQSIGCEIVMLATATDGPSSSMSDVSADTHFLMPVWVTAALGDPQCNPSPVWCMCPLHCLGMEESMRYMAAHLWLGLKLASLGQRA